MSLTEQDNADISGHPELTIPHSSAETVNLYYWPSNRPYSYPTTYVDPELDYTL
jgi:hypothetical protein